MNLPEYRPVVFLGYGYRASGRLDRTEGPQWKCPILTSWRAMDVLPDDDYRFFGRPGSIASKYANLVLQNATHLEIVGARVDFPTSGYQPDKFAPDAIRTHLDWTGDCEEWFQQCLLWKQRYPLPTSWVDVISDTMQEGDILVPSSSGMACEMIAQRFKVKKGQRVIFAPGLGAMGFGLPMAIGIARAAPDKRVFCIEGDGSLMVNIQELESLRRQAPNVSLYVLCNNGYASIRNTQRTRFGRFLGCDEDSGLPMPDVQRLKMIIDAFGVSATFIHIDPDTEIRPRLQSTMNEDGTITPGRLEDIE
jgi:acetolactate synthase-1/2/3 large subunit